MQKNQQQSNAWDQFAKSYNFHPIYGYLAPPDYQITTFTIDNLKPILDGLHLLQDTPQKIVEIANNFPDMELKSQKNHLDMLILRDMLSIFLGIYLNNQKTQHKKDFDQIKVPKRLAVPLYQACQFLKFKYGFSVSITYLWKPINNKYLLEGNQFGFGDFQLKTHITHNTKDQTLFFGGSIIASFYLARAIKFIYEINEIIRLKPYEQSQIINRLIKIAELWKKITLQNQKVAVELDGHFFFNEYRKYLGSFKDVLFQGIDNGSDKRLSSAGGAGGNDPSFQIFQRAFGIVFQGALQQTQADLRTGMSASHKSLISYFNIHSLIRQYCSCSHQLMQQYNKVLMEYKQFMRVHSTFIQNFILKFIQNDKRKVAIGTGGIQIRTLIYRYQDIQKQLIKQLKFYD